MLASLRAAQDDEFAFHLEMETAENMRLGMSQADARRAALLRFGGTQRYRERPPTPAASWRSTTFCATRASRFAG